MLQAMAWLYGLLFIVLLLHELIHFLFIKLFHKKLITCKITFFGGKVTYENDDRFVEILIISLAPSIVLPMIGGLIWYANLGLYFNVFAAFCLLNVVNFLPFTADGRIALYCILKMFEPRWRKDA